MAVWGRHFYGQKFILYWKGYRQHHFAGFIGTVFMLAMYITSLLNVNSEALKMGHILLLCIETVHGMMDSIVSVYCLNVVND